MLPRWNEVDSLSYLFLIYSTRLGFDVCCRRKFENAKKDLKLIWKLLNEVINKQTSKSSLPSSFKGEGKSIIDPKVIADRFFKYFLLILA